MKNRATLGLLIASVAIVAAAPCQGQVYKWVDSNGTVTYSDKRPAGSHSAKTVKVDESSLSVYTPDDALKRAVAENRQRKSYQARPDDYYAVAARPSCAERGMVASPQGGCQPADYVSGDYDPFYLYGSGAAFGGFRHRRGLLHQAQIPPGTIAGTAVGMNGFIPGNSAQAAALAPRPPARRPRARPRSRGRARR